MPKHQSRADKLREQTEEPLIKNIPQINTKVPNMSEIWTGQQRQKSAKPDSIGKVKTAWRLNILPISETANITTATNTTIYTPKNKFVLQRIIYDIKGDGTNTDHAYEIRLTNASGKFLGKASQGGADDNVHGDYDYIVRDRENNILGMLTRSPIIIVSSGTGTLDGTFTIIGYEMR